MSQLLKQENMFYESLAQTTSDRDFVIAFQDYFSFIIEHGVELCTHLHEPLVERTREENEYYAILDEIIGNVKKALEELRIVIRKNKLEDDNIINESIQSIEGFFNGTSHALGGEKIDSVYFEMIDITRRLRALELNKELIKFVEVGSDGEPEVENITALARRQEYLQARNNFRKKDGRSIAGIFIRLKDLYIDLKAAETFVKKKATLENVFERYEDEMKEKEYSALISNKLAQGSFFRKDKYQGDINRFHQSIVVANPVAEQKKQTGIFYLNDNNDICYHEKGILSYIKRGTKEPKYISMFKNIIRYMPANTSEISIASLEKLIPKDKSVGENYRNNLMKEGVFDKFLGNNNVQNIHPKTGEKILSATDKYIYFNNTL